MPNRPGSPAVRNLRANRAGARREYLRNARRRSAPGAGRAHCAAAAGAAVVLSGRRLPAACSELYAGWHRHEIPVFNGNGTGDRHRTEVLWSNRPFAQASLFDDTLTAI